MQIRELQTSENTIPSSFDRANTSESTADRSSASRARPEVRSSSHRTRPSMQHDLDKGTPSPVSMDHSTDKAFVDCIKSRKLANLDKAKFCHSHPLCEREPSLRCFRSMCHVYLHLFENRCLCDQSFSAMCTLFDLTGPRLCSKTKR